MSKRRVPLFSLTLIVFTAVSLMLLAVRPSSAAGPTTNPWPSFRHDLLNSGAAPDSGYPDTANKLWMIDREDRSFGTWPCRIERSLGGGRGHGHYGRDRGSAGK